MGMSAFYSSASTSSEENDRAVIHAAIENNVTLLNTATFYGPLTKEGYGHNLRLLKKCLEGVDRSKVQLMVKIGMDTRASEPGKPSFINRADEEGITTDIDYALEQLGVEYIDIIVLCRVSNEVPIETSVQAMSKAVTSGKAKYIGLSEANATIIRRAHATHPLYCIEQEWSLFSRDIESDLLPTCSEFGIAIVAYSPLGRGMITSSFSAQEVERMDATDYRRSCPRFLEENISRNMNVVQDLSQVAESLRITTSQLALAWLYHQYDRVIPIPGTTSMSHLMENIAARDIYLSEETLVSIRDILSHHTVLGDRYAHMEITYHGIKA